MTTGHDNFEQTRTQFNRAVLHGLNFLCSGGNPAPKTLTALYNPFGQSRPLGWPIVR